MTSNKEYITSQYDHLIDQSKDGRTYQETIELITDRMAEKFVNTHVSGLDVPELIYDSVRFHVQTMRSGRRQSLKNLFNDLGDKKDFPDGSWEHDNAHKRLTESIGKSFPLGTDDGIDKVLGMWTITDVYNAVESRRENLARQRQAFKQFDVAAERAIRAIKEGVTWA